MSNYKALFYPLAIFFAISFLLYVFLSPFEITENPDSLIITSGLVSSVTDYFAEAIVNDFFYLGASIDVLLFDVALPLINPWALVPDAFLEQIAVEFIKFLLLWSNIPNIILIPYLAISFIIFLYGIIKIFLP
jgi:hypothetical protein